MNRRLVWIAAGALLANSGCGRSGGGEQGGTSGGGSSSSSNIHDMRALPYAGTVSGSREDEAGVFDYDKARAWPGYNLFSTHKLCTAALIDMDGDVVHEWHQAGYNWANAELLDNGDLLVTGSDATGSDVGGAPAELRYLLRLSWDGKVVWKQTIPAHHDAEVTPDGRICTLTFDARREPTIHSQVPVRDDRITLIDDAGNAVDSLSMLDLCRSAPAVFPVQPNQPSKGPDGVWIDMFHCNSVEWMRSEELAARDPIFALGNVLVSSRHQDRVFIVNWEQREILWAWGQGEIDGPHDAQTLDNGNILLFDNGLKRGWTRIIELDPLARKIVWEYRAANPTDFWSKSKGSAQRLPNGNTLIANSDNGEAFEVTREGQIVWRFISPFRDEGGERGTIVRIKRYEPAFIEPLLTK